MEPGSLRERNRQAAMDDIRRVAVREMKRAGFDGVTVAGIAAAAGVSESTVYRYFGAKEALVVEPDLGLRLVGTFADRSRSRPDEEITGVFRRAALDVFDGAGTRDGLTLAIADPALSDALLVEVAGASGPLADAIARHRGRAAASTRDAALAGAMLGILLAVLASWTESGKPLKKTLGKQLSMVVF